MSDEEKIHPSDTTLDSSWRALQPGNYKPRTNLAQYKHPLIKDMDKHHAYLPLGVGNNHSAVFIYQQGTIEIVGEVYCWNKRVKPGVYSPFEKLRYLSGDVIQNRENTQYAHHAVYDQFVVPANPYLTKETYDQSKVIEYHYVSFDQQIVTANGDKLYPIPILDGTLTIYPDGTFKAEGIVIDSKEGRYINQYGYIGEQEKYTQVRSYFNSVTKDDVNPMNVYQVIGENEDGSITYGAVEANKNLHRERWVPLPPNIIPINDGRVNLTEHGDIELYGTVITSAGHRILPRQIKLRDLEDHLFDPDWVDMTTVWNPKGHSLVDNQWKEVVLDVVPSVDNQKNIYQYHYYRESITINPLEHGVQFVFKAMPGWDTFVPELGVSGSKTTLVRLYNESQPEGMAEVFDPVQDIAWPLTSGIPLLINGQMRYPYDRFGPDGMIGTYLTIDHTPNYWHYQDISNIYGVTYPTEDIHSTPLVKEEEQPHSTQFPRYKGRELIFPERTPNQNRFIPYNGGKIWFTKRTDGKTQVNVKGSVIWQRNQEYFRIGMREIDTQDTDKIYSCILDDTWPDVVTDENGHPKALFSEHGYFTDEPIFISTKHASGNNKLGNQLLTIDGIKRQEEGLFQLVERNITHHLSDYEKTLIKNAYGQHRSFKLEDDNLTLTECINYYYDIEYTSEHTRLVLDYQAIRFNDYLPNWFNPAYVTIDGWNDQLTLPRLFQWSRSQNYLLPYKNLRLRMHGLTRTNRYYEMIVEANTLLTMSEQYRKPVWRVYSGSGDTQTIYQKWKNNPAKDKLHYLDHASEKVKTTEVHRSPLQQLSYIEPIQLTLPEKHIVTEMGDDVVGHSDRSDHVIYYRWSTDTKYITGEIIVGSDKQFLIPLPKKIEEGKEHVIEEGFVEVFMDDPYGVDKKGIYHTSYYLVNFVGIVKQKLLLINEKEDASPRTERLTGKGDRGAIIEVYANHQKIESEWRVGNGNNIDWEVDFTRYPPGTVITILQKKPFTETQKIEFTLKPYTYKQNEFITGYELFGTSDPLDYGYPYNLRAINDEYQRTRQLTTPTFMESAITINPMNQTYTIHGFVMNGKNEVYPEGTYPIGTKPPVYRSTMIDSTYPLTRNPQYMYKEKPSYRIGTTFKGGKNQEAPMKGFAKTYQATPVDDWVISRNWMTEFTEFVNKPENAAKPYLKEIYNLFKTKAFLSVGNDIESTHIGRYNNKLVIYPYFALKTLMGETLYFVTKATVEAVNGQHNGKREEGLNPEAFYNNLLLDEQNHPTKPWFLQPNTLKQGNTGLSALPRKKVTLTTLGDIEDIPYLPRYNETNPLSYQDNELQYGIKDRDIQLTEIANWDHPLSESQFNGETYYIAYATDYSYFLTMNYSESDPKMNEKVFNHWRDHGWDPNQFGFVSGSPAKVKYNKDGKSVTISGRFLINGRRTKYYPETTYRIGDTMRWEFEAFCTNHFIPHQDRGVKYGTIVDNINGSKSVSNIVYLDTSLNENCQSVYQRPDQDAYLWIQGVKGVSLPKSNDDTLSVLLEGYTKQYSNRNTKLKILFEQSFNEVGERIAALKQHNPLIRHLEIPFNNFIVNPNFSQAWRDLEYWQYQTSLNLVSDETDIYHRMGEFTLQVKRKATESNRFRSVFTDIANTDSFDVYLPENERSNLNIDVVKLRNKLSCLDENGVVLSSMIWEVPVSMTQKPAIKINRMQDLENRYRTEESHYLYGLRHMTISVPAIPGTANPFVLKSIILRYALKEKPTEWHEVGDIKDYFNIETTSDHHSIIWLKDQADTYTAVRNGVGYANHPVNNFILPYGDPLNRSRIAKTNTAYPTIDWVKPTIKEQASYLIQIEVKGADDHHLDYLGHTQTFEVPVDPAYIGTGDQLSYTMKMIGDGVEIEQIGNMGEFWLKWIDYRPVLFYPGKESELNKTNFQCEVEVVGVGKDRLPKPIKNYTMTVVDSKEKIDGYALGCHWKISQLPHYNNEARLNFDILDREYLRYDIRIKMKINGSVFYLTNREESNILIQRQPDPLLPASFGTIRKIVRENDILPEAYRLGQQWKEGVVTLDEVPIDFLDRMNVRLYIGDQNNVNIEDLHYREVTMTGHQLLVIHEVGGIRYGDINLKMMLPNFNNLSSVWLRDNTRSYGIKYRNLREYNEDVNLPEPRYYLAIVFDNEIRDKIYLEPQRLIPDVQ